MKVVVFTLGCKVNECESDSLIAGLTKLGHEVKDKLVPADVYIVNTCAVTAEAEKKSRQTYARIKKLNPDAKIIYTGCAAQKNAEQFALKSDTCLVTGAFAKNKIIEMLGESGVKIAPETSEYEELFPVKTLRTRTFVKVQDGCDNMCSYCIIPYLRGRSRSRAPESVIAEIETTHPKEVVINGINLSAYNHNGTDLAGLIEIMAEAGIKARIRLGSLEVNVITERLLRSLKKLPDFAPHFHLSLQSGSDAVLKKMNRRYTAEEYSGKVDLIRNFYPDAGITTDIIVGFPTETDEDFKKTVELVDKVHFSDIHPFIYSAREGTVAARWRGIDPERKKARLDALIEKKKECKNSFAEKFVGKTLMFLPEEEKDGYTEGYSENYIRLYLKGNATEKDIIKVKATSLFKDGLLVEKEK